MSGILNYYDFTGENVDGDYIEFSTAKAMTEEEAKDIARFEVECAGGGHIDAWYAETGELAFDIEV